MSAFDDYLSAPAAPAQGQSFDAYIGAAPPVPASAAGGAGAAAVPTAAGQPAPLGGFLTGVGDAAKGMTQGIVHGLSWAADKVAQDSQFAQDARAALPQIQQTIDAQNQQYAAQRAANGQTGIDWSRLAGNAVGTLPVAAIGPEYAGLTLPGKLALGTVQGAAGAGMMPVTDLKPGQTFAGQKALGMGIGGVLGFAGPAVSAGASAVGRGVWNAVQPVIQPAQFVGRGLAGAMDPAEAAAAAGNIRGAPQYVPGYQPGTAALAQSPFLVQTEKAAGNLPAVKTAIMNRNLSNNAALWGSLNGVAGTDLDLQNAIAARSAASNPLYNIAKQQNIPVDAPMTDLMSRPAMASAIDRAQRLASNTNAGPIFQSARIPNNMGGSPTTVQSLTGNGAQAVKEALDAMLLPENTQKLSSKEIGALQDTRSAYMAWLEGHSPEFAQARQTFAGMSPPINSMQAAQQMQQQLGGLGRSIDVNQNPILTAPGYATALKQALNGQEFGIEPGAQTTLENIGHELQRSTALNSVPKTGSDTAYNIAANGWLARQLYGPTFGGAGNVGKAIGAIGAIALGHPMVGLGILGGANKVGQMVGGRLQDRLSNYLLDPQALLPYLDARAASAAQAVPNPLVQRLLQYGRPAIVNGLSSGLVNANQ